jgi:hypothetical protein
MAKKPRAVNLDRARIEVPESVLTREIDGEMVLLDLASESYFGLDDVGTRIWPALVEHGTLPGARDALIAEFDVEPAVLKRDLARLVGELESHGLVAIRRG